jgi:hypothetical protein
VDQAVVNNPEPMKAGGRIAPDDEPRRYEQTCGVDHLNQRRRLTAVREHAPEET